MQVLDTLLCLWLPFTEHHPLLVRISEQAVINLLVGFDLAAQCVYSVCSCV